MEASGGAHYWAREFTKLGHTVKLMSPQFVKPYVQSQKNDPNDAAGICEAVERPRMRGVPVKSVAQQDVQALHRIRERQIKARTALINQIRGLLTEYGIVIPQRASQVRHKLPFVLEDADNGLTATAREWFTALAEELQALDQRIATTDHQIEQVFKADDACQRLAQLAGIGPLTATALVAAVGDATELQEWAPVRRLAGPRPPAAFHGREDDAARDDQARESLSPHAAHPWRPRRPPGGRSQNGCLESLAPRGQSPAGDELRQCGPGQ